MLFNRGRAVEYMDRCGLDALVATSPTNITYFSDYYCWLDKLFKEYMTRPGAGTGLTQQFALFPRHGEPALVLVPLLAANSLDSWVLDVRSAGGGGFDDSAPADLPLSERQQYFLEFARRLDPEATAVGSLAEALADRGLADGRIGVECDNLPAAALAGIRESLPEAAIRDCSNLILLIRMVKSPEELERLRTACRIGEESATRVLSGARPGTSTRDMVAEYRALVAQEGADLDHFAVCVRGLGLSTEPDVTLLEDDLLYTDYGCVFDCYCSDSGQTLALREPDAENRARYEGLRDAVAAGAEAARAGAKASSVAEAMSGLLEGRRISGSFPHGHGIGLEVRDYPILVPDNGLRIRDDCVDEPSDLPLETGMVLSLEAGLFTPGAFSFQVECSFVVTDGGGEPLSPQDRPDPPVPGLP
ncbi:MAG: Xaa-Pro peptidase family protein [Gemmatimonadetes bacterium]|nr:Xaa-Pro peptidase family protein [Gemmatimonadota bacterium]